MQMADEVPGQIAKKSPRSSKLLGITYEFILFFNVFLFAFSMALQQIGRG